MRAIIIRYGESTGNAWCHAAILQRSNWQSAATNR